MPMIQPTFNGVAIFGPAVQMRVAEINPVEFQQTNYPRVNGTEEIDLGDRGAWTTATGWINGGDEVALAENIQLFRAARRWGKCVLVDNMGTAWPFVRLDSFQQTSRVFVDLGGLGYTVTYQARFYHAVIPDF